MEELQEEESVVCTVEQILDGIEESSRFGCAIDSVYRILKDVNTVKELTEFETVIEDLDAIASQLAVAITRPVNRNIDYNIQVAISNAPSVSTYIDYI